MTKAIKLLNLVVVIAVIAATIGCDNDRSSGPNTQTLTENDFSEDPGLFAEADEGIVVDFLEPPDSENPKNDTGDLGIDIIPFRYTQTLGNTFCWKDDTLEAEHFMILLHSDGVEVLRVEVNGGCVTEVIEEGDYEMQIIHDGKTDDTLPVFIEVTDVIDGVEARKTTTDHDILQTSRKIFSETMRVIGIIREARAQTVEENVQTLLTTRECSGCDLGGAHLSFANLSGANLQGAQLANATVEFADVSMANLRGANLLRVNFSLSNLSGADLSGADLIEAHLDVANLSGADLSGANLRFTTLKFANLSEANLTGANLPGKALFDLTNLSGATWCDGQCICAPFSFDTCVGCGEVYDDVCKF